MKSLKEKWLSIVQLTAEKGEKGIGGFSTVTLLSHCSFNDFIVVAFPDLARDLDIQI